MTAHVAGRRVAKAARRGEKSVRRSIGIFGGTFDPIHSGHMAIARAAMRRCHLDAIYFVPSGRPPHKPKHAPQAYVHRFAMVALACAGHRGYIASLAEAPGKNDGEVFYSLETVARFRREFPGERLFFIVGADSFEQLGTWHRYEELLQACDFIVVSRPGIRMEPLKAVVPTALLARKAPVHRGTIALRGTSVHLVSSVNSNVSSTEVRRRLALGEPTGGLVPAAVREYIRKQAIYQ
jgi:nicotinate-nucleotide adenylyltransferase